jgi:pimeloyl-ACP methyl ester carboxylesterase
VMLVEGAGHYPQTEQPQAVAKRILEFAATAGGEGKAEA